MVAKSRCLMFSDGPIENWRHILELNILGLSVCTKEAIKSMKERGVDDGHIVHINRQVSD
jgi:NAD(P)-dependent dehydrogenase (short-subunit alcohol dehydrogenase family)